MDTLLQNPVEDFTRWVPRTDGDRDLVRRQMERLLETHHFRNSRRYPALFRFIIDEALAGRGEFLKERLLGVQVFGRPSDYDTASDPVVRVTVAEIRKRIAQYYHDQGHSTELRIELLPGSYEPEFRRVHEFRTPATDPQEDAAALIEHSSSATHPIAASAATPATVALPSRTASTRKRTIWWISAATFAVVLAAASIVAWPTLHPSALDRFWAPIFQSREPVMLTIPVAGGKYGVATTNSILLPGQAISPIVSLPSSTQRTATSDTYLALESLGEAVVFSDVRAMQNVSSVLTQHHVEQHVRLNTAVTLDDLRQGPAVLIGGMDNQWTLRAIRQLRYQFGGSDQGSYYIYDTRTGKPMPWELDIKTPITVVTRDYAIIARIHAEDTGQPEVIIAGIGMSGTAAAGEMLSNPAEIEELKSRIGKGFDKRDFEAVISTDVVNGIAGFAKIVAVEVY